MTRSAGADGGDDGAGGGRRISRRRVVILAAGLVLILLGALLFRPLRLWRGRRLSVWHAPGPPPDESPDGETLDAMVALTSTLHGRRLGEEDARDLRSRFAATAELDSGWLREFRRAARYLDRSARSRGAASFAEADVRIRREIAGRVMRVDTDSLRSELLALVSDRERTRRRMRTVLLRRISWIYTHSPAVWRRRGSPGWPAAPHGPRAYAGPVDLGVC